MGVDGGQCTDRHAARVFECVGTRVPMRYNAKASDFLVSLSVMQLHKVSSAASRSSLNIGDVSYLPFGNRTITRMRQR